MTTWGLVTYHNITVFKLKIWLKKLYLVIRVCIKNRVKNDRKLFEISALLSCKRGNSSENGLGKFKIYVILNFLIHKIKEREFQNFFLWFSTLIFYISRLLIFHFLSYTMYSIKNRNVKIPSATPKNYLLLFPTYLHRKFCKVFWPPWLQHIAWFWQFCPHFKIAPFFKGVELHEVL